MICDIACWVMQSLNPTYGGAGLQLMVLKTYYDNANKTAILPISARNGDVLTTLIVYPNAD